MEFSEKQENDIYEFILNYNTDEEFKSSIQQLYDNHIYKLSILHVYALEEVLRYGTKELFSAFLKMTDVYSVEQAIDLYDEFNRLFTEDMHFKQYKIQQLKTFPETLSVIEMFNLSVIYSSKEEKEEINEQLTEELEYDSLNPISYSTNEQIRETLENLFFGEFICQILELPEMRHVKARQKENGQIANIDKPIIIEQIQGIIFRDNSISQLKQIIDSRYLKAKMNILLGKKEESFEPYLKYNTNISSNEIFGRERDNVVDRFYDYFEDIINNKKEEAQKIKK